MIENGGLYPNPLNSVNVILKTMVPRDKLSLQANLSCISIVLLTTRAPSLLADELMLAGYQVFEALFADEALHLLETEHIDLVVIAHDVVDPEIHEVQRCVTTLRLQPQATAKDVVWELSQIFPTSFENIFVQ